MCRNKLIFAALILSMSTLSGVCVEAEEYSPLLASCGTGRATHDIWFRTEALLWWTSGADLPPLVTTSPSGTPENEAGRLGYPDTTILVGDGNHMGQVRGGFRLSAGIWRDCCNRRSLEAEYWSLGGDGFSSGFEGNGLPIVARPFYDVYNNEQGAQLTSFPGRVTGNVRVETSDYMQSVGTWLRCGLIQPRACNACSPCEEFCCAPPSPKIRLRRFDFLIGYRNYRLNDRLSVYEQVNDVNIPRSIDIEDHFRTLNDFHGTELGFEGNWCRRKWSLGLLATMAVGNNRRVASIDGQQILRFSELEPVIFDEGILALDTNSGRYERDVVCVIPRFAARLGYDFSDRISAFISYDLVYWGDVFRAADQVDTRIDPRNIPPGTGGTDFPKFLARGSHFWAQGISFGAEIRF